MGNVLDYLRWRGDLSLEKVPFCEVDALILALLSILRWEDAPPSSLAEAARTKPVSAGFMPDMDEALLRLGGESLRFGCALAEHAICEVDEAACLQFAAVSLRLSDGTRYLSFRGTDDTLVGWRENISMALSRPVPAQEEALCYLERIARRCPEPLVLGGHSKGGNLAIFAAAATTDRVRERIRAVYSFDSPGLSDRIDAQGLYERLAGRLHSYVPQGSIVGLMLAHPETYAVVRSVSVGILQHDPYSWQVEGPSFERMPGLTPESARFERAFRSWLGILPDGDRAAFVETLFRVLGAASAQTIGREFWIGLAQNSGAVLEAIENVDPATRARIRRMLSELRRLAMRP